LFDVAAVVAVADVAVAAAAFLVTHFLLSAQNFAAFHLSDR